MRAGTAAEEMSESIRALAEDCDGLQGALWTVFYNYIIYMHY